MNVFEAVAQAMGALVGAAPADQVATGGTLCGLIIIVFFIFIFFIAFKPDDGKDFMGLIIVSYAIGNSFAAMPFVGWWPLWTVAFAGFAWLLVIFNPWKGA